MPEPVAPRCRAKRFLWAEQKHEILFDDHHRRAGQPGGRGADRDGSLDDHGVAQDRQGRCDRGVAGVGARPSSRRPGRPASSLDCRRRTPGCPPRSSSRRSSSRRCTENRPGAERPGSPAVPRNARDKLLAIIDECVAAGWTTERAYAVLGVDRRRSHPGRPRPASRPTTHAQPTAPTRNPPPRRPLMMRSFL
jgi:hypothetical protein